MGALKGLAVIRTHPKDGAVEATPGELAYVEFYDEDLPWRYTPARVAKATEPAADRHKLRPWIALLVLREGEFELPERTGATPLLTVADGVDLPPPAETWAWAHAQIGRTVAGPAAAPARHRGEPRQRAVAAGVARAGCAPGSSTTRSSSRRFEVGRLAGLGAPARRRAQPRRRRGARGAAR